VIGNDKEPLNTKHLRVYVRFCVRENEKKKYILIIYVIYILGFA